MRLSRFHDSAADMRVVFITTILPQYRVPFHEIVRKTLTDAGIVYDLLTGEPNAKRGSRGDTVQLPWTVRVPTRYFGSGEEAIVWQPVLQQIWNCDLAIVTQENKLLANYVAQAFGFARSSRLALWGHGRNFQGDPDSAGERWKRLWATRCDWWFTYTKGTKALIESYGFPGERITAFDNSTDTTELRELAASVTSSELDDLRRRLRLSNGPIGIFVGGLHSHKRLDFLFDAAARVQAEIPQFQLLVVGDGPEADRVRAAEARYPWLRATGALFGREKAIALKLSDAYLMPGLVGLGILDAMAVGLPMVTTRYPYHSPEIEYLSPGVNGLIVDNWRDGEAYAGAVVGLLRDASRRAKLSSAAMETAGIYTIENMARRFSDGVKAALVAPKRQ